MDKGAHEAVVVPFIPPLQDLWVKMDTPTSVVNTKVKVKRVGRSRYMKKIDILPKEVYNVARDLVLGEAPLDPARAKSINEGALATAVNACLPLRQKLRLEMD